MKWMLRHANEAEPSEGEVSMGKILIYPHEVFDGALLGMGGFT